MHPAASAVGFGCAEVDGGAQARCRHTERNRVVTQGGPAARRALSGQPCVGHSSIVGADGCSSLRRKAQHRARMAGAHVTSA